MALVKLNFSGLTNEKAEQAGFKSHQLNVTHWDPENTPQEVGRSLQSFVSPGDTVHLIPPGDVRGALAIVAAVQGITGQEPVITTLVGGELSVPLNLYMIRCHACQPRS